MTERERLSVHVRKISGYEGITEGQAHVLRAAADEMDILTAQLQAAQATIAEAKEYRTGFPELDAGLRRILSRADTSALAAVKAEALREAAEAKIPHTTIGQDGRRTVTQWYLHGEATRDWLNARAASIEQEGAE